MQDSQETSSIDLITASGHIGYCWDLTTDRLVWFGPWQTLFGPARAAPPANAQELSDVLLPNDRHIVFTDSGPSFDREYRFCREDGSLLRVEEHGTTDFEKGRAVRQQGLIRLVENDSERSSERARFPDRDPLTGRPNRLCMQDLVGRVLHHPREDRRNTGYMVVGIDKLALVNEGISMQAGDQLICAVADRLTALCPPRAIVGRVNGDMFGILLPGLAREMEPLADKILQSFFDQALITSETHIHLSVCIGCLTIGETDGDAASMMLRAEQALLEARQRGYGNKSVYRQSERHAEKHRAILDIYERVRVALKDNTVRLVFQPIVDAKTNKVVMYEALARIFYESGMPIPAGEFIPIIEQMGLAPEFDKHILDMAIRELRQSEDLHLAVNVSGLTAAMPGWPDYVQDKLRDIPEIAARLTVEITETAAVMDIVKIKKLIVALHKMGSQAALDDFGAGATSIRHLRDLDFAVMKIDRELILELNANAEQQHLVRMLIAMAHGLGLRAIAEGIEDEETALWLRKEGVDLLQGYLLGRPSFDRPWMASSEQRETTSLDPAILNPRPAGDGEPPVFRA